MFKSSVSNIYSNWYGLTGSVFYGCNTVVGISPIGGNHFLLWLSHGDKVKVKENHILTRFLN